jgi:hypothetical protein
MVSIDNNSLVRSAKELNVKEGSLEEPSRNKGGLLILLFYEWIEL